jgi:hypothetical protein
VVLVCPPTKAGSAVQSRASQGSAAPKESPARAPVAEAPEQRCQVVAQALVLEAALALQVLEVQRLEPAGLHQPHHLLLPPGSLPR